MKSAVCKSNFRSVPYPNAATKYELFQKFLDGALVAACGMGIGAMLLLFLAMR